MKALRILFLLTLSLNLVAMNQQHIKMTMEQLTFPSTDGLKITADYYPNDGSPLIILCHQAGFSRGEYIATAPKLVAMGYACLALDQRSGEGVNDIVNETAKEANSQGKRTAYADAYPDIKAAITYAKETLGANKIMLVGSSYSSSLAIIAAAQYGEILNAIASFSPGEYFKLDHQTIGHYAGQVDIPTFITSARNEEGQSHPLFNEIKTTSKQYYIPKEEGIHGSRALWDTTPGHQGYWEAFTSFLDQYFPAK